MVCIYSTAEPAGMVADGRPAVGVAEVRSRAECAVKCFLTLPYVTADGPASPVVIPALQVGRLGRFQRTHLRPSSKQQSWESMVLTPPPMCFPLILHTLPPPRGGRMCHGEEMGFYKDNLLSCPRVPSRGNALFPVSGKINPSLHPSV